MFPQLTPLGRVEAGKAYGVPIYPYPVAIGHICLAGDRPPFLGLFEADFKQPRPVVLDLLKPVESGLFSRCPRTGLLWALEWLAWNPQYLPRVNLLLAQLSKTSIDDHWMNKPIHSLEAIFRSWMPQTAAPLEERMKALEVLTVTGHVGAATLQALAK